MTQKYVFTNCLGVLVFDEEFNVVDTIPLKDTDRDLEEWIDEEKEVIEKYSNEDLLYIGKKKEKLDGIKLSEDPVKIKNLIQYLKSRKAELYKINLVRTKLKLAESVNEDWFVVQCSNHLEELNKVINILAKRLREWYELYNPEFSRSIESHEKFATLILEKNKEELLQEIKVDIKETMGADLKEKDLKPIFHIAEEISSMYKLKAKQEEYLESIMTVYCPNVTAMVGSNIAGRLLQFAGSLKKLSEFPASTVQLLGAEKALFRHMKTGARCPKYGVIINHPLITKADRKDKGKVSRSLADKISIAAKLDYFKGEFMGDKLLKGLEERFK